MHKAVEPSAGAHGVDLELCEGASTTVKPPLSSLVSGYEPFGDRPVDGHHNGLDVVVQTASEDVHAGVLGLQWITACAASATSGASSSGTSIAALGNEISYRVIP